MALIIDPDDLSQGLITAVADAVWGAPAGATVTITSAGSNFPSIGAGDFFEIRDHSDPENNGLYQETGGTPTTGSITADKITGVNPIANAVGEAIRFFGSDATLSDEKSVHFDLGTREIRLIQQGNLSTDGVTLQAVYSFAKEEWKGDADLIPFPFPIIGITSESFEFIDDWVPFDNTTRKLMRTGGWSEIDINSILKRQLAGVITLGTFEDPTNDTAYYSFGDDTVVDDSVDFDFAGPVNEPIETFFEFGNPPTCNFATTSTITRASGSFVTDGYKVGGSVTIRNADQAGNDGTFILTAVVALTLTVTGTPFTVGADTNAQLSVDNRGALTIRLRVRDADPNGKTFAQSDLAGAGVTVLTNKVDKFPVGNETDLKISATDATIDGSAPYTGMSITWFATPQARLIGGSSRDFGIIVDGNNGTAEQIYEFVQRQLRKLTDIDADADIFIGRLSDELLFFTGDTLRAGSTDSPPNNPDGGGTGVYIDNFDSNDTNRLEFVDNLGVIRTFPFVAAGTITFNSFLVSDSMGTFWMFFEYTERFTNTGFGISAASGSVATLDSSVTDLVAELALNDYINLQGFANAENNGIWQVTGAPAGGGPWTAQITKTDGATVVNETAGPSVSLDKNPINSPDAIIVEDNSSVPINGAITGATLNFDFDYDGNVQGGRDAGTDAPIVLRAIGLETAQFVETTGLLITRAVGLAFSLVSAQERNYSNP